MRSCVACPRAIFLVACRRTAESAAKCYCGTHNRKSGEKLQVTAVTSKNVLRKSTYSVAGERRVGDHIFHILGLSPLVKPTSTLKCTT